MLSREIDSQSGLRSQINSTEHTEKYKRWGRDNKSFFSSFTFQEVNPCELEAYVPSSSVYKYVCVTSLIHRIRQTIRQEALCCTMSSCYVSGVLAVATLMAFLLHGSQAQLSPAFYDSTCPNVSDIVQTIVQLVQSSDPRMPASLLRLHFHDCFVDVDLHSFSTVSLVRGFPRS